MLELKNVSKQYGTKQALKDVSLTLPCGEIVGLFGENGAGKTTLMKCILGLTSCRGTITLDGEPVRGGSGPVPGSRLYPLRRAFRRK